MREGRLAAPLRRLAGYFTGCSDYWSKLELAWHVSTL
jgi:hypothetical protein